MYQILDIFIILFTVTKVSLKMLKFLQNINYYQIVKKRNYIFIMLHLKLNFIVARNLFTKELGHMKRFAISEGIKYNEKHVIESLNQ